MAEYNEFLIMLGEIRSDVKNIKESIEDMQPVIEDYKSWKNKLIGICAAMTVGINGLLYFVKK